jgi:hypothetical protein
VRCDDARFPAEHELAYVASWSAAGAIFGYLVWAVADRLDANLRLDAGQWMQIGAGFTGAVALAWVLAGAVLG